MDQNKSHQFHFIGLDCKRSAYGLHIGLMYPNNIALYVLYQKLCIPKTYIIITNNKRIFGLMFIGSAYHQKKKQE